MRRRKIALTTLAILTALALAVPLALMGGAGAGRYPEAPGEVVYESGDLQIDVSNARQGYVMAKYGGKKKVKLRISNGDAQYTYDFLGDDYNVLPLQMGDGAYRLLLYEQVKGNQYAQAYSKKFDVRLDDPAAPFTYPNQYVNFAPDSAAVAKSQSLLEGAETDRERYERVCEFVVANVKYDYIKAVQVQNAAGYLPDVDQSLADGMGICFDFAALMATMLRSQGLACKLIIGYADQQYHAWNETLIDGNWYFYDSTSEVTGLKVKNYTVERVY